MFLGAPRNSFDYPLAVEDTLTLYDLSFYTRMDGDEKVLEPLRLDIAWVAPADTLYRETVWMYAGDENGRLQRYRSDLRFPSAGEWTLKVSVSPQVKGFRGLGLVWKEKDGTR